MNRQDLKENEYHAYYSYYLNLIPALSSLESVLKTSLDSSITFIKSIEKPLDYKYATDKWSIGEVILHNIDTERIFSYRALRFMRGDTMRLPGFDQDVFASDYRNYAFAKADLIQSLRVTRNATIELFKGVPDEQLLRQGIASDSPMSVRVIPFLIAGPVSYTHLTLPTTPYV